jgi:N-acetylneuraminic acid mutarotase
LALLLYISCGKDDGPTDEPKAVEINSFSPPSGEVGTEVTITGKNFSTTKTENSVSFNGTAATVKEASASQLKVNVPSGATTGPIKVTVGNNSATSTASFEVLAPEPTPAITNISEGEWEWEDEITITGTDFSTTGNTVLINGVEAEIVEENETHLKVIVPYGSRTGKITVTRANNGTSTESSEDIIIYHGKWTEIAGFGAGIRRNAVAFVLDGTPYVGLGTDGTANSFKDFWEYNPGTDGWGEVAEVFSGDAHLGAVSFVIGDIAYVGTGILSGVAYPDFWKYSSEGWEGVNEANTRWLAVAFSIGNKGYIGTGLDENGDELKDFWEYDPSTGVWTQKADLGGPARYSSVGFSIDGKGYIGGGNDPSEVYLKDFWEYDPANNEWTQKADIGGEQVSARGGATSFTLGEKGYVGLGRGEDDNFLKDFWEYDPSADTWTRIADFPGASRMWAVAFVVNGKAYVGTGYDENTLSDFWELDLGN